MFDHIHYVPILKWKKGEQDALKTLNNNIHNKFTPLIELPYIETDFNKNKLARSIEEHLNRLATSIKKNLIEPMAFIDFKFLDEKKQLPDKKTVIDFFEKCKKSTILIPVVSTNSSINSIEAAKENTQNGICFRLNGNNFDNINAALQTLKHNFTDMKLGDIDLLLDLESINSPISILKILTNSIICAIPDLNKWRTVTLSASTFPLDLSLIKRDTITLIPRLEWSNWINRFHNHKGLRIPTFGDYPISHPDIKEIDFRYMDRSASIRYSDESNWVIVKGRSLKKKPQSIQNRENSNKLINHPSYFGPSYSWGDNYIKQCADGITCGNSTTWRQVGVNHHITLVINQLSNLL